MKTTTLNLYSATFTIRTFVAAENPEEAAIIARDTIQSESLSDCNWNILTPVITLETEPKENGLCYYDTHKYGCNLHLDINQAPFEVESAEYRILKARAENLRNDLADVERRLKDL